MSGPSENDASWPPPATPRPRGRSVVAVAEGPAPPDSPPTSPWAVDVVELSVAYGSFRALRDVSLRLGQGEKLALFGLNGAGKTTLIRALAMLMPLSHGEIVLCGYHPRREPLLARKQVGVLTNQTHLYPELTAEENLRFYGRLFGIDRLDVRVTSVLEQVGALEQRHRRVGQLSRGMQQRVAVARAILHDPAILLLDEPEIGLDVEALHRLEPIILTGGDRPRTLVLATHRLEFGLGLADRAAVLNRGRLVFDEPSSGLSVDALERVLLRAA